MYIPFTDFPLVICTCDENTRTTVSTRIITKIPHDSPSFPPYIPESRNIFRNASNGENDTYVIQLTVNIFDYHQLSLHKLCGQMPSIVPYKNNEKCKDLIAYIRNYISSLLTFFVYISIIWWYQYPNKAVATELLLSTNWLLWRVELHNSCFN